MHKGLLVEHAWNRESKDLYTYIRTTDLLYIAYVYKQSEKVLGVYWFNSKSA